MVKLSIKFHLYLIYRTAGIPVVILILYEHSFFDGDLMFTDKLMKNCVYFQNTVTDLDLNFLLIGICTYVPMGTEYLFEP